MPARFAAILALVPLLSAPAFAQGLDTPRRNGKNIPAQNSAPATNTAPAQATINPYAARIGSSYSTTLGDSYSTTYGATYGNPASASSSIRR